MKTTKEKHQNEKASISKHSESHHGSNDKKLMEDHSKNIESKSSPKKSNKQK
ncbi:MAG TPA: hypothetical protein VKG26_03725 [Bacteroidia bacterium]|nr:hypothetical protein [Bacteroidia bacterium]